MEKEPHRIHNYHSNRPAWYQAQIDADAAGEGQNTPIRRAIIHSETVQPKLEINPPDDIYEKEADQVAESVVQRMEESNGKGAEESPPSLENDVKEGIQRACADCEEEVESMQRSGEGNREVSSDFQQELISRKGQGNALPKESRTKMESGIGADFSGVNVHTDAHADRLSRQINAKAFTHGKDVFFKEGEFDTSTTEGNKLLAHELTHVVQQGGGEIKRDPDDGPGEQESKTKYRVDLGDLMGWEHVFSKQFVGIQYGSYWNAKAGRFVSVNIVSEVIVDERVERFNAENASYMSSSKYNGPIDAGLLATNGSFAFAIIDTNSGKLLEEASVKGIQVFQVDSETGQSQLLHQEAKASDVCEKSGNFAQYIQLMKDYGKTHRGHQGMVTPNAEVIAGMNSEDSLKANDGLALGAAIAGVALAVGNAPMSMSIGASIFLFGASVALPRFLKPLEYTAKINYVLETVSYAPKAQEYNTPKKQEGMLGDWYHGNYGQIGEPEFDGITDQESGLLIEMPEWMPRVDFDDMKKSNK